MKLCTRSNIAEVTLVSDDCDHNYEHFERCQEEFEIENNAIQQIFKITQYDSLQGRLKVPAVGSANEDVSRSIPFQCSPDLKLFLRSNNKVCAIRKKKIALIEDTYSHISLIFKEMLVVLILLVVLVMLVVLVVYMVLVVVAVVVVLVVVLVAVVAVVAVVLVVLVILAYKSCHVQTSMLMFSD